MTSGSRSTWGRTEISARNNFVELVAALHRANPRVPLAVEFESGDPLTAEDLAREHDEETALRCGSVVAHDGTILTSLDVLKRGREEASE